jgi:hypothetical protein
MIRNRANFSQHQPKSPHWILNKIIEWAEYSVHIMSSNFHRKRILLLIKINHRTLRKS